MDLANGLYAQESGESLLMIKAGQEGTKFHCSSLISRRFVQVEDTSHLSMSYVFATLEYKIKRVS